MSISEIKANARKALEGKWGKVAIMTLIYALLMIGIIIIPLVGAIAIIIIGPPISYGRIVSLMKLKSGEDVTYTGFWKYGFSNFKKVWKVYGRVSLKLLIPSIIGAVCMFLIITGIIVFPFAAIAGSDEFWLELIYKAFIGIIVSIIWIAIKGSQYSLSFYILYDNPNMTSKEIVNESKRLMKGNRVRISKLDSAFTGFTILSYFMLGIGFLWLNPYRSVAQICFYEALIGKASTVEVVEPENIDSIQ